MASEVVMPRMGLTMEEGTLVSWRKAEGQKVNAGEPLFEIETDKSTVEIEADKTGVLGKILVQVGTTVPVGTVIGILVKEGETLPACEAPGGMQKDARPDASLAGITPAVKFTLCPPRQGQSQPGRPHTGQKAGRGLKPGGRHWSRWTRRRMEREHSEQRCYCQSYSPGG